MSGIVNALDNNQLGTGILPGSSQITNAAYVVRELVAAVCVTHAHLDHISGFVLNSSCFSSANPKVLCGLPWVVDAVLKHVFNGVIWPNMTNEGDDPIGLVTLRRLNYDEDADDNEEYEEYEPVANGLFIRALPISHGCVHASGSRPQAYESTAYFIQDSHSNKELLFFGDVEPDSISIEPRNRSVWIAAARKFAQSQLAAIFIECSYASIQPKHSLFGHLSPPYLIQELKMFASLLKCPVPDSSVSSGVFGNFTFDLPSAAGTQSSPATLAPEQQLVVEHQQLQFLNQHPYSLHPHPHFHHSRHLYSPASSRRQSAASTHSAHSTHSVASGVSISVSDSHKESNKDKDQNGREIQKIQYVSNTNNGPLSGLVVVITHVKGLVDEEAQAESIILEELQELLVNEDDLSGLKFVLARTGQTVII